MSIKDFIKKRWGVCQCGHYQWQHDNSSIINDKIYPAKLGHGRCNIQECSCEKFTWVKDVEPDSKLCPTCYQPYNKCVCENNAKFEYEQEQERLRMEVEMEEEQRLSDENAEEYWSEFK